MSSTTTVSLAPSPGFCIKSTALNPVSTASISIPTGIKVFVNVAWDANVPPPPDGSDAAIERAISNNAPEQPPDWFVPVIIPDPRSDTDKAGKPSVVFDAIFNTSLKPRALRSAEFKTFLIELAFQRIESQYNILLSRQIGTPNILSKGKLKPRSVLIPTSLYAPPPTSRTEPTSASTPSHKPLIQELSATAPPKGILKNTVSPASPPTSPTATLPSSRVPALSWSRTDDGRLRIVLSTPKLTRSDIPSAALDVEPRRLIFTATTLYGLDLDLSKSDKDIQALFSSSDESARQALMLKRERPLDVDGARAEWRVADSQLVIYG